MNNVSISKDTNNFKEPQYTIMLTITASNTKTIADLNKSGSLLSLVRIFLMILPLHVWKPVFITIAYEFPLVSKTLEPSFSHVLFYSVDWMVVTGNFPIG